ncbi:MAG TPA: cytochrome B6, partial [Blastocatellia bacterium]|nr:cytochrome B6 [Blastocatellia bacterium]
MTFEQIKAARLAVKAQRAKEHMDLLNSRYALARKTTSEVAMSGGKPVPVGPTAKLSGVTWAQLDKMAPDQIKEKGLFPYKP